MDVEAWGKSADNITKFFSKGKAIYIEGSLKLDTWDDKTTGAKRSKHKIVLEKFEFIGGREGAPAPEQAAAPRPASAPRQGDLAVIDVRRIGLRLVVGDGNVAQFGGDLASANTSGGGRTLAESGILGVGSLLPKQGLALPPAALADEKRGTRRPSLITAAPSWMPPGSIGGLNKAGKYILELKDGTKIPFASEAAARIAMTKKQAKDSLDVTDRAAEDFGLNEPEAPPVVPPPVRTLANSSGKKADQTTEEGTKVTQRNTDLLPYVPTPPADERDAAGRLVRTKGDVNRARNTEVVEDYARRFGDFFKGFIPSEPGQSEDPGALQTTENNSGVRAESIRRLNERLAAIKEPGTALEGRIRSELKDLLALDAKKKKELPAKILALDQQLDAEKDKKSFRYQALLRKRNALVPWREAREPRFAAPAAPPSAADADYLDEYLDEIDWGAEDFGLNEEPAPQRTLANNSSRWKFELDPALNLPRN